MITEGCVHVSSTESEEEGRALRKPSREPAGLQVPFLLQISELNNDDDETQSNAATDVLFGLIFSVMLS